MGLLDQIIGTLISQAAWLAVWDPRSFSTGTLIQDVTC